MAIPSTQIAAAIPPPGPNGSLSIQISSTHPVPSPGDGEVLIKLEFSGVCHSDVHSIRGDTPMLTDVAGHEGVGKVVAVGSGLDEQQWIGQRVGIRWLYSSCLECEICAINHTSCPYQKNAGANVPGTFQQYLVSPAIHATKIPPGLSPDIAAPLLCAGIAMYSSIKKTKARPGDSIVILGAGGGLGHMGVQIAAKKGLKVIAVDKYALKFLWVFRSSMILGQKLTGTRGEKKRKLCLDLGASEFLDFTEVDIVEAVKASTSGFGAHAVICTANGEKAYEQSMQMLRRLGTLVCVGIPNVPFKLPVTPLDMIVKGLTIVGNSAGSATEMEELMEMAVAGEIKACIEVFDLADILDVLKRLENAEIEGRVVLKIPE
ncbi:Alcohol dehydrogenase 1 [Penicillium cataractarum]|uniref:Alcohol dehydrogenase 1 n=1 Tax=Penicillium cataractarum TaxID=2100454 RepID=A0A9W9UZX1_9EURO|nr:Alcohol dehydrogenase 1 [Penicillium cataractarum]KAJ5363713.1 Alcohol dehydrogenase 1 [Penicillium cataractarum]